MYAQPDPILSEKDLAIWLSTSCPTLQRLRAKGSGPPFIRLSERRIGYRTSAVEQWLASRTAIGRPGCVPPRTTLRVSDTTTPELADHRLGARVPEPTND